MNETNRFPTLAYELLFVKYISQVNHSAKVTSEDHAHEVTGPAGLFSWDYLFQLRSPLSLKAGEQVKTSLQPLERHLVFLNSIRYKYI